MACQVGEVGMVIFLHTVQFPEYMLARCGVLWPCKWDKRGDGRNS